MTRVRRPRLERSAWEAAGGILAACLGLLALSHALGGAKRSLLIDDGDSVLLPLMLRSLERGEPFHWGLSPVLFAFPELPLYASSALIAGSVAGALLLNGVLNVVILYALLRWLAGSVLPGSPSEGRGDRRAIAAALAGVAVFTGLCLLETRAGGNTLELASLYLTTTYYSGTVMALLAATVLVARIAHERRDRRIRGPAIALGVVSALGTWSNPLFVLWAAAPLAAALLAVAAARLVPRSSAADSAVRWRATIAGSIALLVGSAIGYLARGPLAPYLLAEKSEYLRWGGEDATLAFARDAVRSLVATPGGAVEAGVAALLIAGSLVAAGAVLGRARLGSSAVVVVAAAAAVVGVPLALVATGSISTRYALPLLFFPLAAFVVGLALIRRRNGRRRPVIGMTSSGARGFSFEFGRAAITRLLGAALATALVVAGGVSAARVAAVAADPGVPGVACLTTWAAGAPGFTGVGQFWTIRDLQAYGGDSVRLAQVNSDFTVYPWLSNLAPAEEARVGYVIVATEPDAAGHLDYWGPQLAELGTPRDIVHCETFDIYDYRGSAAVDTLTDTVTRSARLQATLRGLPL